ncbi:hypothetical protein [Nocardioides sp.]|uniref:hypothetical protein n=1 Tax=Nocardioides sp. TaxID=35761 RepID=UPI00351574E8
MSRRPRTLATLGTAALAGAALIAAATPAQAFYLVPPFDTEAGVLSFEDYQNTDDSYDLVCTDGEVRTGAPDFTGGPNDANGTGVRCDQVRIVNIYEDTHGIEDVDLTAVTAADFPLLKRTRIDTRGNGQNGSETVVGSFLPDRIAGANTASGGAGDDVFVGITPASTGTASVDGGPGDDLAAWDFTEREMRVLTLGSAGFTYRTNADSPVSTVALSNVERVRVLLSDRFYMSGIPTSFDGAGTTIGVDLVAGTNSNDLTLTTGSGEDAVESGSGDDTVTLGGGADTARTGGGADTISSRDGAVDRVFCGSGTDSVTADAEDVLVGCETVSVSAPQTRGIVGPTRVIRGEQGVFGFSASTEAATFQCSVDRAAFTTCRSPLAVATKKLKAGKHTLAVRAVVRGVADATPSTATFTVVER